MSPIGNPPPGKLTETLSKEHALMAHEISSVDGLVLAGKPAWHGLGVVLPEAPTPMEALQFAGLDWQVNPTPLFLPNGQRITTHQAMVRGDTSEVLGVTGSDFHPLQNRAFFEFLQALGRKVESAGSFRRGRTVFALLRQEAFQAGPGDTIQPYLFVSQGHDGTRSYTAKRIQTRVVCANTDAIAMGEAGETLTFRHTAGLTERIKAASLSLERAEAMLAGDREDVWALSMNQITDEQRAEIIDRSVLAPLGHAGRATRIGNYAASSLERRTPRSDAEGIHRTELLVKELQAAHGHSTNRLPGMDGTAWQTLQAISWWAQHERSIRTDRGESCVQGSTARITAAARNAALEVIGRR